MAGSTGNKATSAQLKLKLKLELSLANNLVNPSFQGTIKRGEFLNYLNLDFFKIKIPNIQKITLYLNTDELHSAFCKLRIY